MADRVYDKTLYNPVTVSDTGTLFIHSASRGFDVLYSPCEIPELLAAIADALSRASVHIIDNEEE